MILSPPQILQNVPGWLLKRLGHTFEEYRDLNMVISYDNVIYTCAKDLPPDVLRHEAVHLQKQHTFPGGPGAYVERYCSDQEFALAEELEAYRAQYRFICSIEKDKNLRAEALMKLAFDLSGTLYDFHLSTLEASRLIRGPVSG